MSENVPLDMCTQQRFRSACDSGSLGPVVHSIASLTSSLVVRMLTALVSTVSDTQLFLLK